jgi:hypothetical protein
MSQYSPTETKSIRKWVRFLAPLVPYFTVGAGVLIWSNAWIAIFSYHLVMILVLLLTRSVTVFKRLTQCKDYRIPVAVALAGLFGGVLLYLLWPSISKTIDLNSSLRDIHINSGSWPLLIPYLVLVNPWLEECFWRGYLGSDAGKPVLNDFLFAGYHLLILAGRVQTAWLVVVFVILFCAAWGWRQITRINGGLLASNASHMAADASILVAVYYISISG